MTAEVANFRIVNLIIFLSFIDFLSASSIILSIGNFLRSLGASKMTIGLFASFYGALQLPSSYLMGMASSRYGIRNCLIASCLLSSLGYLIIGSSTSVWFAFVGRSITGLFKHTNNLSRTLMATMLSGSSTEMKAKKMGQLSSTASLGFIVGPLLGGFIYDSVGFFYVTLLGANGFFLIAVLTFIFLEDESSSSINNENDVADEKDKSTPTNENDDYHNQQTNLFRFLLKEYFLQLLMGLTVIIYRANYSLVIKEAFHLTTTQVSFLTSYQACVGAASGILFAPFLKYIGRDNPKRVLLVCSILRWMSIIVSGLLAPPSVFLLVLSVAPLPLADTISRESFQLLWSQKGITSKNMGKVIGLSGSLFAFARLVGPFVGGVMHELVGTSGPALLASFIAALSVLVSLSL